MTKVRLSGDNEEDIIHATYVFFFYICFSSLLCRLQKNEMRWKSKKKAEKEAKKKQKIKKIRKVKNSNKQGNKDKKSLKKAED